MCEPTTWIMVAGAVVSAFSSVQKGRSANKVGAANARVQTIMAQDAIDRGEADEASQRRKTAAFKGRQAAVFGASGGEINTGSSAGILADTAEFGELDALRVRSNAEREAFGFLSGAAISRAEGKNARTTGFLDAAGTILSAAGAVSSKWNVFKADNPSGTIGDFLTGRDPIPSGMAIGGIDA